MGNVHRKRQGAVQMSADCLKILFIGNSHTYYNDMPSLVKQRFEAEGYDCHVTMLAHPGWFLAQHVEDPEAKFNILYGEYDYVVLQEHAHPFGPEEKFYDAVRILTGWIKKAGSTPVIYLTWAKKSEPEAQDRMTAAHSRIADETGSLVPSLLMSEIPGGAICAAGRIWRCMRETVSTPPLPVLILQRR